MIQVLESWPNGPLRQFSDESTHGWSPYQSGSFTGEGQRIRSYAGKYVCRACQEAVLGVYAPLWLCSDCRKTG